MTSGQANAATLTTLAGPQPSILSFRGRVSQDLSILADLFSFPREQLGEDA
jgi:hypothetical protein